MKGTGRYEITILPGTNKEGVRENFDRIVIRSGDTLSIVGPTGSGKSALINDIEVLAQGDTATGRRILVNGQVPDEEMMRDPAKKPIALITQSMRIVADLDVERFITLHLKARGSGDTGLVGKTISLANTFTGEAIYPEMRVSTLSGGQTRALLIADAILIGQAPILLLDEVENAGIDKERVMECIRRSEKTVIFVTHDPYLALSASRRIVMENGAVSAIIEPGGSEKMVIEVLSRMERFLVEARDLVRKGKTLEHYWGPLADSGMHIHEAHHHCRPSKCG